MTNRASEPGRGASGRAGETSSSGSIAQCNSAATTPNSNPSHPKKAPGTEAATPTPSPNSPQHGTCSTATPNPTGHNNALLREHLRCWAGGGYRPLPLSVSPLLAYLALRLAG